MLLNTLAFFLPHFYMHAYVFLRKILSGKTDPDVKLNAELAGSGWLTLSG